MRSKPVQCKLAIATVAVIALCLFSCSRLKPEPPAKAPSPEAVAKKPLPKEEPSKTEILLDPNDESKTLSYWRDAKAGDWVRFLTHRQDIAIFEVIRRDEDNITFEVKHFTRDGKQIIDEEPDIRKLDVTNDDKNMRNVLLHNLFVKRSVCEWKTYNSNKILQCERHYVDNPRGNNCENIRCREIRCGSYVFMRRGAFTVALLVDWGDADNPPKWDHLKPAELLKYWCENNKFTHEKPAGWEDQPKGEPPEESEK